MTRPVTEPGDVNPQWGPRRLYPEATFERGVLPTAPMAPPPENEVVEWPGDLRSFAGRIRVPVRFTFGDHERLWSVTPGHFADLRALLAASPRVEVDVHPGAGHNVSLSRTARAYHLKALAFAEECLTASSPESTRD